MPESGVNDLAAWITVDEIFDVLRRRPDFSAMIDGVLDAAATALRAQIIDGEGHIAPGFPGFLAVQTETLIGNRAHGPLPAAAALGVAPEQADVYDNWRDQLRFVACADGSACLSATSTDSALSTPVSVTENCRALVLFGGERRRGDAPQRRSSAIERADPAQYLEGDNLTSFTRGEGDYAGARHYTPAHRPASEDLIRCVL